MLEQKNRLLSLGDILKQSDIDFKQAAQHYQDFKNQHSHSKIQEQNTLQDIKNYQKQSQDLERKIYDIQNNRKIAETKMDSIAQRRILIERELTESTQILNKALDDLSKISGTDHLKEQAEALKLQVTQKRMSLSDARSLLETHRRSANERANRFKLLQKDLGGWQDRMTKANERIMDCEKRLSSIQKEQEQIADLPEKLKLKSENAKENITMAQARFDAAKNASEGLEGELSIITKTLREDTAESAKLRETKVRYEAYQEMSLLKEHDILQKIQDKKDSTPPELHPELEQYPDEHTPHISDIEDKLKQLTRERDALGAVNLIAHTQLTQIEEQSLTLINEKNDLLLAIKKLSTAIHDINKDGRMRMLKAFDIVNSNFKRLFQHLFSGGTAELQLIESDDPLEAGLEVAACPPGKKTNSLTLLSGGEQALTCMALIFAVFLTNPSPICVLDEVDAPLDDANVERYCNMIQEMTKMTDTRFLVITHHALTMARTDRLFGVTMAERGVSQLVSVDLQAAEKLLTDVMA
jgi:chromosome segregation protein